MNTKSFCNNCKSGFIGEMDFENYCFCCPICTEPDWFYMNDGKEIYHKNFEKYSYTVDNYKTLGHPNLKYCGECKIVFDCEEEHSLNYNYFNGKFISKWKYQDNIYYGMPQFDTDEEYFEKIKDIEIIEMVFPNKNKKCIEEKNLN